MDIRTHQIYYRHPKCQKNFEESSSSETKKPVLSFAQFGGVSFGYPVYLDYMTKMADMGCAKLNPEEPYLITDFTDCVLFCLGRNYLQVVVQNIPQAEGKVKCSCSPALQSGANTGFHTSECKAYGFRHIHLQPLLPENQEIETGEEKEADLNCVDTKMMTLVKTIEVKQFSKETCREYCDMQSFPLAVYKRRPESQTSSCSCSPTLIDSFRARTSCSTYGDSESLSQQILTSFATQQCGRARLLDEHDPPYPIVGLLTVPGSGNTWTRLLIQHLTGILTGSVYRDPEKVRSGLYGESLSWPAWPQNYSTTFVIKTHNWEIIENRSEAFHDPKLFPKRAITVIRDPIKSAIAEFNRDRTSQYGSVSEKSLTGQDMDILAAKPVKQVNHIISQMKIIEERGLDVLYLSYEDMMKNLMPQLFRIQHFLGFEDAQSVERTFCAYFRKKEDEKIKRPPRTDFVPKVLSHVDLETMTNRLNKLSELLQTAHAPFLKMPHYIRT